MFTSMEQQAMRNVFKDQPMRLVQLTFGELRSFADLFSHGIEDSCLEALLRWLPNRLKRPEQSGSWTQRSATQFYRDTGFDIPLPATLCEGHSVLNAALVQDALAGVLSEADESIEELVDSIGDLDRIPERLRHRVIDEAQALLAADSSITEGEFYYFHKRQPPGLWWGCRDLHPCCLLSKVANTSSLLSALRACQLASLPDHCISGQKVSVRLKLVESWIYALEPRKALDVISISSAYGTQLRGLRKSTPPKQSRIEQHVQVAASLEQVSIPASHSESSTSDSSSDMVTPGGKHARNMPSTQLSIPISMTGLDRFAASSRSPCASGIRSGVPVPPPLEVKKETERPNPGGQIHDRRPVDSFYGLPSTVALDRALPETPLLPGCYTYRSRVEVSWDPRTALRLSDMSPPPIDYGSKPSGTFRLSSYTTYRMQ